jgi:hypothetical protein
MAKKAKKAKAKKTKRKATPSTGSKQSKSPILHHERCIAKLPIHYQPKRRKFSIHFNLGPRITY